MTGGPANAEKGLPANGSDEVIAICGQPTPPATEEDYRRQIGRRARLARTALGLSQDDIAVKAGLTRNFVSATERGAQGLDTWRLRHLADALAVSTGWLLGLTEAIDHPDPRSPGASS